MQNFGREAETGNCVCDTCNTMSSPLRGCGRSAVCSSGSSLPGQAKKLAFVTQYWKFWGSDICNVHTEGGGRFPGRTDLGSSGIQWLVVGCRVALVIVAS